MTKLFVGSLAWSVTTEELVEAFSKFGELDLENTKVVLDRETGKSRGFAFVEFKDEAAAKEALEQMNGYSLSGRAINVSYAKPREDNPDRNSFRRSGPSNRGNFDRRY